MPTLTIPPEYRRGLVALQRLSDAAVDELSGALRRAPVRFYRTDLAEALHGQIKSIPDAELNEIIDTLASLEFVRVAADASLDEFIDDLAEAITREELSADNDGTPALVARINQLLQIPSLAVPAKARTLLLEGRTICRAKVITDIRPVFGVTEIPSQLEGALIVHNLRISYHESGSRHVCDFIVALDSNDLDALIETLQRAKVKEDALAKVLHLARTPYLKVE